jgi:hypothetical protein
LKQHYLILQILHNLLYRRAKEVSGYLPVATLHWGLFTCRPAVCEETQDLAGDPDEWIQKGWKPLWLPPFLYLLKKRARGAKSESRKQKAEGRMEKAELK